MHLWEMVKTQSHRGGVAKEFSRYIWLVYPFLHDSTSQHFIDVTSCSALLHINLINFHHGEVLGHFN
jgi:hypothetical protein